MLTLNGNLKTKYQQNRIKQNKNSKTEAPGTYKPET